MSALKNEIVVNKEKGFTKIKIANVRYFNKQKKMATKGTLFYVYIYEKKLRIVKFCWNKTGKRTEYMTISYKRGCFTTFVGTSKSRSFGAAINFLKISTQNPLDKIHLIRLEKVFKKWCESLGHVYKCSKNPELTLTLGKLIYPAIQRREYQIDKFVKPRCKNICSMLRRYLSLKEVIRNIVGSCGKKTYKIVCEKIKEDRLGPTLDVVKKLSSIFSLDDIQKIVYLPLWKLFITNLSYYTTGIEERQQSKDVKEYLFKFSKKILFSQNPHDLPSNHVLADSIRMWKALEKPEIESDWTFNYAHDELSKRQRAIRDKPFDLNPSNFLLEIDGLKIEDYTIVVPKISSELREWGEYMHNCIFSYANRMKNGDCHLFGVKSSDELLYNVMFVERKDARTKIAGGEIIHIKEVKQFDCEQFYGKYNQGVEIETITKILDALPYKIKYGPSTLGYAALDNRRVAELEF